ncbi:MAG: AAA family ATPase, partial [Alkalispirochaeta sp.]
MWIPLWPGATPGLFVPEQEGATAVNGAQWRLLIERAAHTTRFSRRGRLWLEAIDQGVDAPRHGSLTAFSPPESTGVADSGGSPAAEVYRLGVVGYALLAGREPWQNLSDTELRRKILTEHLPEVSDGRRGSAFLGRMNRIIARATEKDPTARFSNLQELHTAVAGALASLEEDRTLSDFHPRLHRQAYRHIDRWLDRARSGVGTALAVVGASGIGKTYLWETIHDTRWRRGERWHYVKARQVGQRPYETITLLLESVRDEIAVLFSDGGLSPPVHAFLHAIAPHIVPVGTPGDASEVRDPAGELADLIQRIGTAGAFQVVCFDDFQWIDAYSRTVIEALVQRPDHGGVAMLSREEIPGSMPAETVHLKPLNREQAREFVRSGKPSADLFPRPTFDRVFTLSGGNPMILQSLLSAGTGGVSSDAEDVLIAVAAQRMAGVSSSCRSVLSLLALVGIPVSQALIVRSGVFPEHEMEETIAEAERALLVHRSRLHDSVRFSHDSIETAARRAGEDDPNVGRRAIRVLITGAREGNDRAAYAAVGLLPIVPTADISQDDWNMVLIAAARRAVYSLAPAEALQIVAAWHDRTSPTARLELYQIAHEAAYLLGDRHAMSRYYRAIVAGGDREAAAEARYLWIRRCYADARFHGAAAVGVRILSEAPVIEEGLQWASDGAEAIRFLRRKAPQQLLNAILRRGYTSDRAVRRATDTLGRMLLPVLTTDRGRLVHVAYYTLRIAMERGATPLTPVGFIAWALYLGTQRTPGRWVKDYMTCARRLSAFSGDRMADHSVRVLCAAFGDPWTKSYPVFADRLERLQTEGRQLGNHEFTAHALHIQRQALLYRGDPSLSIMADTLSETRREIRSFGLVRTDTTLAKHHAAVEALEGRTDDP